MERIGSFIDAFLQQNFNPYDDQRTDVSLMLTVTRSQQAVAVHTHRTSPDLLENNKHRQNHRSKRLSSRQRQKIANVLALISRNRTAHSSPVALNPGSELRDVHWLLWNIRHLPDRLVLEVKTSSIFSVCFSRERIDASGMSETRSSSGACPRCSSFFASVGARKRKKQSDHRLLQQATKIRG